MSDGNKKQLLSESQIRRFAKLANIEALSGKFISEMSNKVTDSRREDEQEKQEEGMMPPEMDKMTSEEQGVDDQMSMAPAATEMPMDMGAGEGAETIEVGGDDVDPEKQAAFEAAVKALADSMGIEVELESQEDNSEEGGEEMHDLSGEDSGEGEEDSEEGEEEEGEEEETQEEAKKLSEDDLVEAVLARVTARLVSEAKKKKMSAKEKMKMMKMKKKSAKKEELDEATDAKGGGPLLSKGGNKHDTYKGHADMKMGKPTKTGSGGHKMEDMKAESENTDMKTGKNLSTMGGNKKK